MRTQWLVQVMFCETTCQCNKSCFWQVDDHRVYQKAVAVPVYWFCWLGSCSYGRIDLSHSCLFLDSGGSTIGSAVPVSIWEVGARPSAKSWETFWEWDDQSKHVCKPVVYHCLFILLPFLSGSTDLGCVPLWGCCLFHLVLYCNSLFYAV